MIFVNSYTLSIPVEYPPQNTIGPSTPITTAAYGNGNYTVSASTSVAAGWEGWRAFDKSINPSSPENAWATEIRYNSTGGYTGGSSTNGVSGEWIDLVMPSAITLTSYSIQTRIEGADGGVAYIQQPPNTFTLMGSGDGGTTWTILNSQSGITWSSSSQLRSFNVAGATPFNKYRLVINKNNSVGGPGAGYLSIAELRYFGY